MLEFCSLYSGSSGNCLYVHTNSTNLLIDCGTSAKKVCEGLASINSSIENIDAILITHEHSDHIQGLGIISNKYNIPVYANKETFDAMGKIKDKIINNINFFENDTDFNFQDLTIHPFSTSHDAANPCGFNIHNGHKKLSIATDLGYVDDKIFKQLEGSSFILLESNYDPEILKVSRYPFKLKERIAGPQGHLSNETAGKTISALLKSKDLKEVALGHLSKENNFPELAYTTVTNELINSNNDINTIKISVASRTTPGKIITIK